MPPGSTPGSAAFLGRTMQALLGAAGSDGGSAGAPSLAELMSQHVGELTRGGATSGSADGITWQVITPEELNADRIGGSASAAGAAAAAAAAAAATAASGPASRHTLGPDGVRRAPPHAVNAPRGAARRQHPPPRRNSASLHSPRLESISFGTVPVANFAPSAEQIPQQPAALRAAAVRAAASDLAAMRMVSVFAASERLTTRLVLLQPFLNVL